MSRGSERERGRDARRGALLRLLQRAHAGERAAFLAYRGHALAVRDPVQREAILRMAEEELAHRREVGAILRDLDGRPSLPREALHAAIGHTVAVVCQLGAHLGALGWYAAMDGAGRLEAGNVDDYLQAARLALELGEGRHAPALVAMAQAEWDHERWFRDRCADHPLSMLLPIWTHPGPRPPDLEPPERTPAPAHLAVGA